MSPMPIIRLSTGLMVGNFGSPHQFTFVDGFVLPQAELDRVEGSMLEAVEVETPHPIDVVLEPPDGSGRRSLITQDIELEFHMSPSVFEMLVDAHSLWESGHVDIVLVPLPCLTAMKRQAEQDKLQGKRWRLPFNALDPRFHPFRTVRVADRVSKRIHIDRFCV